MQSMIQCPKCKSYNVHEREGATIPATYKNRCEDCGHLFGDEKSSES